VAAKTFVFRFAVCHRFPSHVQENGDQQLSRPMSRAVFLWIKRKTAHEVMGTPRNISSRT